MKNVLMFLLFLLFGMSSIAQEHSQVGGTIDLDALSMVSDSLLKFNGNNYLNQLKTLEQQDISSVTLREVKNQQLRILYVTERWFQYVIEATNYLKRYEASLTIDEKVKLLFNVKKGYDHLKLYPSELEINRKINELISKGANYPVWEYYLDSRVYAKMLDYDKAATALLNELEQVKTHPEVTEQLLVSGYNDVGYYNFLNNDPSQAIPYYKEGLQRAEKTENESLIATIKGNLGTAHEAMGDHELARFYLLKDIAFLEERQNNTASLAFNYITVANSYTKTQKLDSALYALRKAHIFMDSYLESSLGSLYYRAKADYHFAKKQLDSAQKYSTLALTQNKNIAEGQSRYLIEQTQLNNQINESLANLQDTKIEAQQEQIYLKTKQTNRIIALLAIISLILVALFVNLSRLRKTKQTLALQNIEIQKNSNTIEKNLGEKELLLKEIHHRVKNNLQVISSMLELQNTQVIEPEVKMALEQSKNRIQTIALMHRMMYQSESVSKIDMSTYLPELVEIVKRTYKKESENVRFYIEAQQVDVSIKMAVPLNLIIHELLCNSLKYAFAGVQDEVISIIFEKQEQTKQLCLTVKDNGCGLPKNFVLGNSNSLGFDLIQGLTRQLKGQLTIHTHNGTEVHIIFPHEQHGKSGTNSYR